MKTRAAELRAGGTKGAKKAGGLQAVLDSTAQRAPADRALGERVHPTVTATALDLSPQDLVRDARLREPGRQDRRLLPDSGKFTYRYPALGFEDTANLNDVGLRPLPYALQKWSPAVEKKVAEQVKAAVSCRCPRPPHVALPGHRCRTAPQSPPSVPHH